MAIKFVYFDVGGVLVFDFSGTNKWTELKRGMGVTAELDTQFDQIWHKYESKVCIDYDVDGLLPLLSEELGILFSEKYSLLDDFVNRFEFNVGIWSVVDAVKQKYQVGLLTNQFPRMFQKLLDKGLLPKLPWHVEIDSSVVGCQKPDEKIFELAEVQSGVNPGEILFVENTQSHIDVAKSRGWQTLLYDPTNSEKSDSEILETLALVE